MTDPFVLLPLAAGIIIGALLCWLLLRATIQSLRAQISAAERFRDRTLAAQDSEKLLRDAFTAMSAEALAANNEAFLSQAKQAFEQLQTAATGDLELRKQAVESLVAPIREGLAQVDTKLQALDAARAQSHGAMEEMVRTLASAHQQLAGETSQLVAALRQPSGRGQWGELQLRRVVELAGMLEHCDFVTQETVQTDDAPQRPDLIVRLPGEKVVVVDAKAPLLAYLDAVHAPDEATRATALDNHARQVRQHVTDLSKRDYTNAFTEAPDFVVLFLPGEAFFAAACERDPSLLEYAVSHGVIPASPTTLITLLKAVNYGWQQERIAKNAEAIRDNGLELYERMATLAEHLVKVRKGLEGAVRGYNDAMGSLERRVLPTARRFRDLGLHARHEIPALAEVQGEPLRIPAAAEISAE